MTSRISRIWQAAALVVSWTLITLGIYSVGRDGVDHVAEAMAVPIPGPGDAGTVLTSNGPAYSPSWQAVPSSDAGGGGTTLTPLEFFSIVTFTEGVADSGLNSGGGGYWIRNNTGNPPSNTVGTSFYVTQPGHSSTGIRFYYFGYDASNETCSVEKASIWQTDGAVRLATTNVSVTGNGEYTGTWSSVPLLVGVSYAVTLWDLSGTSTCCGSAGTCSQTSFTEINATTGSGTVLYSLLGGATVPVLAGPWAIWGNPIKEAGTTTLAATFTLVTSGYVDNVPDTSASEVFPIEPVLQ